MSQPTDETDVPQEEGLVSAPGLEGEEEELPQEEGFIDTDEEEVDEEEDPPEGEEEEGAAAAELAVLGAITRPEVLRRGNSWIKERVMYSQRPPPPLQQIRVLPSGLFGIRVDVLAFRQVIHNRDHHAGSSPDSEKSAATW